MDQSSQTYRDVDDESLYTQQSEYTSCHEDIVITVPQYDTRQTGFLYHVNKRLPVLKWIDAIERKDVYHFLACCLFVLVVVAFTAGIIVQKGG